MSLRDDLKILSSINVQIIQELQLGFTGVHETLKLRNDLAVDSGRFELISQIEDLGNTTIFSYFNIFIVSYSVLAFFYKLKRCPDPLGSRQRF